MAAERPPIQPRQVGTARKFWEIKNLSEEEGELLLYGEISDMTWWGDEVTPKQFLQDLKDLGDIKNLTVRINSPGGDVFAAQAIYTNLREHKANVTVKIDGIAASAATIVAMAGNKIMIPAGGYMMIHNPLTVLWGMYNADDLDKMSDTLGVIKDGMINAYTQRTGKDKKAVSKIMDAETWYTGEEAVAEGFADELMLQASNADPQDSVVDGNRLIVKGVGFDMAMLPQRLVASFAAKSGGAGANKPNHEEVTGLDIKDIKNIDELRRAAPELCAQLEQTANTAGAEAERKRIQAIDELTGTVDAAMIKEAKFTNATSTAESVALAAMKAGKVLNSGYLTATANDANNSNANQVAGAAADPANGRGTDDKAALAHVGDIAARAVGGKKN